MRWSDTTWHNSFVLSAVTVHKGILFRVTIELPPDPVVTAEIIDSDGLVLFQCELESPRRSHRHIKPALRAWVKEGWMRTDPDKCFDWFPTRAMRFGLDTAHARHETELRKYAKRRMESAHATAAQRTMKLGEKLEQRAPALAASPDSLRQNPGSPRLLKSVALQRQRRPLLSFDGPLQVPGPVPELPAQGAYDRLRKDRSIRWQVHIHVCYELSQYGERRDKESFQRFLALINSFWAPGGVSLWHVDGNPDAVRVEIWPDYDQPKEQMTLDLKGIV